MRHRADKAFSLVELLVVLAIVAVLIAILLPTISAVRRRSRITQCASNLRQIGEALHNYRSEQWNWPVAAPIPPPFDAPSSPPGPAFNIALADYLPVNSSVYHCPGDIRNVYDRCASQPRGHGISYEYWIPFQLPKTIRIMMEDFQGYGSPTKSVVVTQFHPPHNGDERIGSRRQRPIWPGEPEWAVMDARLPFLLACGHTDA